MTDTVTSSSTKATMGRTTALLIALITLLLGAVGGYYYGTMDKWWKWASFETVTPGTGKSAADAYAVSIELEGKIKDGETFAPKAPFPIPVTYDELADQAKMPALVTEIKKMNEGGTYDVTLPAAATKDAGPPLGGQTLMFNIKLVKVLDKAGYEAEKNALIAKQMEAMGSAAPGGAQQMQEKDAPAPKAEAPAPKVETTAPKTPATTPSAPPAKTDKK